MTKDIPKPPRGPQPTAIEKQLLEQVGWKEGDPIPQLSNTQAARKLRRELGLGTEADEKYDVPDLQLSQEEQAELQERMQEAQKPKEPPKTQWYSEQVRQAVENAPEIEIVDDTKTEGQSPAADQPVVCQRCGHVHGTPVAEPTDEDRYNFLQTVILGAQRFQKDYMLFGDRIRVRFRTLTPSEERMIYAQLDEDTVEQRIKTHSQWFQWLANYEMAASIAEFQRTTQEPVSFVSIKELDFDATQHATPLPSLLDFFFESVFVSENVRRPVGQAYVEFQRLIEAIETEARRPDFCRAIESDG